MQLRIKQLKTFKEMDVGIDECHCGLTSGQGQRPVLVLIPVNGIVTQNFELQRFTFNQGPVLKEIVHYANSFPRRISQLVTWRLVEASR